MSGCQHITLMAEYNAWMNEKLYAAAATLAPAVLAADRKAFFGSIIGTLNHSVVADRIWLARFAAHPAPQVALNPIRQLPVPTALNELLFADIGDLFIHRKMLDAVIKDWAAALTDADLASALDYANMKGVSASKRFGSLVIHFFNHQTHHRGQATTLLSQAGVDVGITDLLALIPNENPT
jgi:uncharacterized damage-inducible protein DinB